MLNFRNVNRFCSIRLNLERICGCWFGKALFLSRNINGNSISQWKFWKKRGQLSNHTATFHKSLLFRPLNGCAPNLLTERKFRIFFLNPGTHQISIPAKKMALIWLVLNPPTNFTDFFFHHEPREPLTAKSANLPVEWLKFLFFLLHS